MSNYDKIILAIKEKYQSEERQFLINELDSLYDDNLFLRALESNGVDNWEWYSESIHMYNEWREENGD